MLKKNRNRFSFVYVCRGGAAARSARSLACSANVSASEKRRPWNQLVGRVQFNALPHSRPEHASKPTHTHLRYNWKWTSNRSIVSERRFRTGKTEKIWKFSLVALKQTNSHGNCGLVVEKYPEASRSNVTSYEIEKNRSHVSQQRARSAKRTTELKRKA